MKMYIVVNVVYRYVKPVDAAIMNHVNMHFVLRMILKTKNTFIEQIFETFILSGRGIVVVQEISNFPPCASSVRI